MCTVYAFIHSYMYTYVKCIIYVCTSTDIPFRGLLMPKIVVDDFGGTRTDPGMLGSGIYFASSSRLTEMLTIYGVINCHLL